MQHQRHLSETFPQYLHNTLLFKFLIRWNFPDVLHKVSIICQGKSVLQNYVLEGKEFNKYEHTLQKEGGVKSLKTGGALNDTILKTSTQHHIMASFHETSMACTSHWQHT